MRTIQNTVSSRDGIGTFQGVVGGLELELWSCGRLGKVSAEQKTEQRFCDVTKGARTNDQFLSHLFGENILDVLLDAENALVFRSTLHVTSIIRDTLFIEGMTMQFTNGKKTLLFQTTVSISP